MLLSLLHNAGHQSQSLSAMKKIVETITTGISGGVKTESFYPNMSEWSTSNKINYYSIYSIPNCRFPRYVPHV